MNSAIQKDVELVEKALESSVPVRGGMQEEVWNAMRYSLLDGGKRLRPVLALEFCKLSGGTEEEVLPFACAIEMVHSYSLIHDDLPCMDNAAYRRGRPSNHKVYGEAMALLAGDGLLSLAFETMLQEDAVAAVGPAKAAEAAGILARASGACGMVGGQAIDIRTEGKRLTLEELEQMDAGKTGALILASAEIGCVIGGADCALREAARKYAAVIGLAFQIQDDVLDATGDEAAVGKTLRNDSVNEKCTYVTLMGLERAVSESARLTEEAVAALRPYGEAAEVLIEIAESLTHRKQ